MPSPHPVPRRSLQEGDVLAQKYEIVRLLGRGGMGAVYEARNRIGRRVALKVLLQPELADDKRLAARFMREARTAAGIESQHIVQVFDTDIDEATALPFIVMELLRGQDLEQIVVQEGRVPPAVVARIGVQAATGLSKAHDAGIIHRDIKPANIFLALQEVGAMVKILDFGIAKESLALQSQADRAGLTKTGALLGTPLYMSPEQTQGAKHIDPRTDVWSLGVCLYYALAGQLPWGDVQSLGALVMRICSEDATPLCALAPWVPEELATVVHRALARSPARRTASMNALADDLRPFCEGATRLEGAIIASIEGAVAVLRSAAPNPTPSESAAGMAASRIETKRSTRARALAGIGAIVALVGVGAVGVVRSRASKQTVPAAPSSLPRATVHASQGPGGASSGDSAIAVPSTGATEVPVVKTARLKVRLPPGSTVSVDNRPVPVVDGGVELTGPIEQAFYVSVHRGGDVIVTQKVYMGDGFVVPNVLDTAKGAVAVVRPTGGTASGTGSRPSVPTATGAVLPVSSASSLPARF